MLLADKFRTLRETEGQLRGFGRAITQGELVRAIREETGEPLSQSYLSQIESGARPHLTNTTRLLLARFFKVHPGYLVDDPEGYHAELLSDARTETTLDAKLDSWLIGGAERFRLDPELHAALLSLALHPDSRACLLLLESVLEIPGLKDRLLELLRPGQDWMCDASSGPVVASLAAPSQSSAQPSSASSQPSVVVTAISSGDHNEL